MTNSQNTNQPHIRKKLETSGALETFETAKIRTRAIEIIKSGEIEAFTDGIKKMIAYPGEYIHGPQTTIAWVSFSPFLEKGIITKRNPHRGTIDEIEGLLKQADYNVGRAKVEYAATLPPIGKNMYTTQGKVAMILSGIGM